MVAPSFEMVTSWKDDDVEEIQTFKKKAKTTPMLSTSILSSPRGPNELFTTFAIDRAAITGMD